jgi:hypothetical protein
MDEQRTKHHMHQRGLLRVHHRVHHRAPMAVLASDARGSIIRMGDKTNSTINEYSDSPGELRKSGVSAPSNSACLTLGPKHVVCQRVHIHSLQVVQMTRDIKLLRSSLSNWKSITLIVSSLFVLSILGNFAMVTFHRKRSSHPSTPAHIPPLTPKRTPLPPPNSRSRASGVGVCRRQASS